MGSVSLFDIEQEGDVEVNPVQVESVGVPSPEWYWKDMIPSCARTKVTLSSGRVILTRGTPDSIKAKLGIE